MNERLMHLSRRLVGGLLLPIAALATSVATCLVGPPEAALTHANPRVQEVIALQDQVTKDLMQTGEILGTAVGHDDDDDLALLVFVNAEAKNRGEIMRALPRELRGIRVKGLFTDRVRAMGPHTRAQVPPIQLGTSGGWTYDLANGYCCCGTLGGRISINGVKYLLSNYHVLEADIVSGGNGRVAITGDPVAHPALIDTGCSAAGTLGVATLTSLRSLPDSNVDAAIAQVVESLVQTNGSILEIGMLSSSTLAPALKKAIKKSGRTTGLTKGKITGLNATISVSFASECGGGLAFTKTFTNQIIIANTNYVFLNNGDSGSLLVEDVSRNPRTIGLLFAASNTIALANPIDAVLAFIRSRFPGATVKMVGK